VMSDDPLFLTGPGGKVITLTLPPRGLRHWQPHHKAMLVAAVRRGSLSLDVVFRRYGLSIERYLCWYQCYAPQPPENA
jgi:hypothetical protein